MFTDVLRSLRKKHGDTQESLAAKINVPARTYASWERSERIMPNDVLVSIADLYGVTVDYLLGRDDFHPLPQSTPPLVLDGDPVMGWADDRPETQAIARELYAMALNIGATKEDVDAFRNYMLLTKGEQNYIKTSMKALRSQHKEEEGT